jgi:cell division protein FtsB
VDGLKYDKIHEEKTSTKIYGDISKYKEKIQKLEAENEKLRKENKELKEQIRQQCSIVK